MDHVWIATYANMDGESSIVAVSDSCVVVDQACLKRIEKFVEVSDGVQYKRKSTKTKITYLVHVGWDDEETGKYEILDTIEWYEIKKHPILTPQAAKKAKR